MNGKSTRTRPSRIQRKGSRSHSAKLVQLSQMGDTGDYRSGEWQSRGRPPLLGEITTRRINQRWEGSFSSRLRWLHRATNQRRRSFEAYRQTQEVNEVTTLETRTGCIGLVSNCGDHYHYFFDFDAFTDDAVLYSAMFISQEAKCDLLIRRSSENCFHVICPNPMSEKEVVSLQRCTPRNPSDLYLHLDEVLLLGGQRGTGNTLRLYGKHQVVPKSEFMLWVGDRPVCLPYTEIFNLNVPSGRKIVSGSPTYAYYTTRLKENEVV